MLGHVILKNWRSCISFAFMAVIPMPMLNQSSDSKLLPTRFLHDSRTRPECAPNPIRTACYPRVGAGIRGQISVFHCTEYKAGIFRPAQRSRNGWYGTKTAHHHEPNRGTLPKDYQSGETQLLSLSSQHHIPKHRSNKNPNHLSVVLPPFHQRLKRILRLLSLRR